MRCRAERVLLADQHKRFNELLEFGVAECGVDDRGFVRIPHVIDDSQPAHLQVPIGAQPPGCHISVAPEPHLRECGLGRRLPSRFPRATHVDGYSFRSTLGGWLCAARLQCHLLGKGDEQVEIGNLIWDDLLPRDATPASQHRLGSAHDAVQDTSNRFDRETRSARGSASGPLAVSVTAPVTHTAPATAGRSPIATRSESRQGPP